MYLRYLQYLDAVVEKGSFALAAKACGVRVNEFSIGMGPALFSRVHGGTQYSLRLLPIGGYVSMEGEDGEVDPDELGALLCKLGAEVEPDPADLMELAPRVLQAKR